MVKIFKSFFIIFMIALSGVTHSLEVIEILGGKASQIPIAVTPFKDDDKNNDMQLMHEVIANDLSRSGLFSPIDISGVSQYPYDERDVNFSNWSALQSQFILLGKLRKTAVGRNNLQVEVIWSLVDIYKEKTIMTISLKGPAKQYRLIAHRIADIVYEKLTGSEGIFQTNIAFVKKFNPKQYSLFISDYDGFNPKAILNSKHPIISPRWSPDGKKLHTYHLKRKNLLFIYKILRRGKELYLPTFGGIIVHLHGRQIVES